MAHDTSQNFSMLLHGESKRLVAGERPMIGALSIISILLGAAFAWMAHGHPRRQPAMESIGGILLIAGFALLGYSLECMFCRP